MNIIPVSPPIIHTKLVGNIVPRNIRQKETVSIKNKIQALSYPDPIALNSGGSALM
jgi:hypothetical protein